MPKPIQHEEILQKSIAAELRLNMPKDIPWTAVESSGRGPRDGARQRDKGVNKSWADLQFVIPPLGTYLGIELKTEENPVTGSSKTYQDKGQKQFEADIKAVGGYYHVARSMAEVWGILAAHGIKKGRHNTQQFMRDAYDTKQKAGL